jgi:K+-transporting ATPase A subunit
LIVSIGGILKVFHQSGNASSLCLLVVPLLLLIFVSLSAVVVNEALNLILGKGTATLSEVLYNQRPFHLLGLEFAL